MAEQYQYYLEDVDKNLTDDIHDFVVRGGMIEVDNFLLQEKINQTTTQEKPVTTNISSGNAKETVVQTTTLTNEDAAKIALKAFFANWLLIAIIFLLIILIFKTR